MLKKILFILAAAVMTLHALGDIRVYSTENNPKSDLPAKVKASLEANGFTIAADTNMIKPFMIQFQHSDYDVFHLLTAFHTNDAQALVLKYPDAGIFVPMGFGIYQAKGEKQLHVSVLTAEAMAKIMGLKSVDPLLTDIEKAASRAIEAAMPKATVAYSNDNPLPAEGPLVSKFVYELEEDDDADEIADDMQMGIENNLGPLGFVLSNSLDFNDVLTAGDTKKSPFEFYNSFSICKLKVIYNVAKTRPEAAAFAPCTLMMYKLKDKNEIVTGFPGVYNWLSSARVENAEAKAVLMKAQHDFEAMLTELTE